MWPDDGVLPVRVEAAFGANLAASSGTWTWTDLSSRLRGRSISWREGRSSGARNVSAGTLNVDLDNDDGALTPLHPMSTYWPYVRRNTPIRVSVFWGGAWRTLLSRFADQWKPGFRPITGGKTVSVVSLTASGLLRRLEQGVDPLFSAPRRYIPTTSPVAYWPLEDGQLASEGAALVGGQPMRPFVGTHPAGNVITFARWGRGDLAPWLPDVVSRSGSAGLTAIWAPVTMPATPGRWVVDFMYRSGMDAGSNTVDVNPSYLPGGALGWPQLYLDPSFREVLVAMNGEPEVSGVATTLFDDLPHHVRWDVYQNAAKVSWNVYVDGAMVNFGTTSGNMTLPSMATLAFVASAQNGADIVQGHIAAWTSPPTLSTAVSAAFGYAGETAAARVTRLCAEESVPVAVGSGESEPMGPQSPATLVELLREAEDADMGVLYESGFGLAYRPRGDRYNAPLDLTIDLAEYRTTSGTSGDVLVPTYDDRGVRNRWTISRPDGGTVTVDDAIHQAQFGVYRDSAKLNLLSDGRLTDQGSWRNWIGTAEVLREDAFPIDLLANPGLIAGVLNCAVGSRIVRTNPPSTYGPGPLDALVEGWSGSIGPRAWMVQVAPSPATVWDVATVDGDPRVAADGSGLVSGLGASALSMLLSSTIDNGPWTEDPTDFPQDIRVGGEQVTASAISPAVVDTFTRSVASSWGTADTGQAWTTTGGAASDYSVSGGSARHLHTATGSLHHAFVAPGGTRNFTVVFDVQIPVMPSGAGITVWAVVRGSGTGDYYAAQLMVAPGGATTLTWFKRVSGALSAVSSAIAVGTHTSGAVWRIRAAVLGSSLHARAWIPATMGEPGYQAIVNDASVSAGTDVGVLTRLETGNSNALPVTVFVDNFTVINPQVVTLSARGVGGVQRAWPAGTEVDVWEPAIVAL